MTRRFGALVFAIFALSSSRAGELEVKSDVKGGANFNVTAECQMVLLPQKAALVLIPELMDDDKVETAFARLLAMINNGEAKLEANLIAKSEAGKRAWRMRQRK